MICDSIRLNGIPILDDAVLIGSIYHEHNIVHLCIYHWIYVYKYVYIQLYKVFYTWLTEGRVIIENIQNQCK